MYILRLALSVGGGALIGSSAGFITAGKPVRKYLPRLIIGIILFIASIIVASYG